MKGLLAIVALLLIGCSGGGSSAPPPIPAISVSPTVVHLPQNCKLQLTSTVPGTKWTVDSNIIQVNADGLVAVNDPSTGATVKAIGTHPTDSRATAYCLVTPIVGPYMSNDLRGAGTVANFWVSGMPVPGATPTYSWTVTSPSVNFTSTQPDISSTPGRGALSVRLSLGFDNGIQPMVTTYTATL